VALELRVVMILPQVHLRNGEILLKCRLACVCVVISLQVARPLSEAVPPPCGSPARHFRRAFLSHGSAFAGGGLNIRPPRARGDPNPYSLWTFVCVWGHGMHAHTHAARFAADCPLQNP
jgi:hypothetical protein